MRAPGQQHLARAPTTRMIGIVTYQRTIRRLAALRSVPVGKEPARA